MPYLVSAVLILMVLAAIPLVAAPSVPRTTVWLESRRDAAPAEPTVVAARAAIQRIGTLSGAAALVMAVVLFIADVDFYLAMVGYAAAAIIGAAAPLGGGLRRRVELTSHGKVRSSTRVWQAGLGLGVVTTVVAAWLLASLAQSTSHWVGMLRLDARFWMAAVDLRQLTIITAASLILFVLSVLARIVVSRRQSVAGADPHTDAMIRQMCTHRISWALLGGQAILLGALLPALQVLTLGVSEFYFWVNNQLVVVTSVIGWAVIVAGVLVCAVAVLSPVWIRPRRRSFSAEPAAAAAGARSGS